MCEPGLPAFGMWGSRPTEESPQKLLGEMSSRRAAQKERDVTQEEELPAREDLWEDSP